MGFWVKWAGLNSGVLSQFGKWVSDLDCMMQNLVGSSRRGLGR